MFLIYLANDFRGASSCRTLPKMKKKEGYYAKNIHKITVY
jgi:hypothetical protein